MDDQISDDVTTSNDEDGVADYLEKLFFGLMQRQGY